MLPNLRHPVLRSMAFIIPAPPLVEFENVFWENLRGGELALCAYGMPRIGKSTAGKYLRYRLEKEQAGIFRNAALEKPQNPSRIDRAEFWRRFLGPESVLVSSWRNPASAREALVTGLMVEAEQRGTNTVVLMIDEAQNLTIHHFSMLKLLLDELIDLDKCPFLLMLAQPEITRRPDELLAKNLHDLVDRFFTQVYRMRGLHPAEFPNFIGAYDELRWAPPESPVRGKALTFTEYFAPGLSAQGGLRSLAKYFRTYFQQMQRKVGREADDEIETKFLVTAIRRFLLSVQSKPELLNPNAVAAAVEAAAANSGLYASRRQVGDAEQLFATGKSSLHARG